MGTGRVRAAWWVVAVTYVVACLWAFTQLPERPWSHFGANGVGDDQMSRADNLLFSLVVGAALMVGLPLLTKVLVAAAGPVGINLPHADYWLVPERIERTKAVIVDDMTVLATLVGALLTATELSLVVANRRQPAVLGPEFFAVGGVFLVGTVVWLVSTQLRYRRLPTPA